MYDLEETKLIEEIKKRNANKILLQLPEGLKKEASRLINLIETKTDAEVIVSGEHCWGACDVAINEAKSLNADLIILYGHAPFMKVDFPILYLETRFKGKINGLMEKTLPLLKNFKNIGIASSVQHLDQLKKVKEILEKNNKNVFIPDAKGHAFYDGQVLGCEYNGLKKINADAFLVIANKFHALGAALAVKQPVFLLDPYNKKIESMQDLRNKIIKQRAIAIERVKNANKIGLIIGLKHGQKFGSEKLLKEKFKKLGKEVITLSIAEITNDKLLNFYDVEAFVEIACPRIAIEDVAKFEKPIITFKEALVVLNELTWDELLDQGLL